MSRITHEKQHSKLPRPEQAMGGSSNWYPEEGTAAGGGLPKRTVVFISGGHTHCKTIV